MKAEYNMKSSDSGHSTIKGGQSLSEDGVPKREHSLRATFPGAIFQCREGAQMWSGTYDRIREQSPSGHASELELHVEQNEIKPQSLTLPKTQVLRGSST